MIRVPRLRALLLLASLALIVDVVPSLPSHAATHLHADGHTGPGQYYLSLGDSLAFGYQPVPALRQGFGFSDDLAASLEKISPELKPVNLGCPGESSATFINGGCPGSILTRYSGTQLGAALTFLNAHRGRVSPITYVLGADDILGLLKAGNPTQIQTALRQFAANDDAIVRQLRRAAPSADIVTMDYYNPFTVVLTTTAVLTPLVAVTAAGNAIIDQTAARYDVRVANLYAVFNTPSMDPLQSRNPVLCNLTWICSPYHDIHPTIVGYKIMAGVIGATLGYPGLTSPTATNPTAISVGVVVGPGAVTWFWIGDRNASQYDAVVYHYDDAGNAIMDGGAVVPAGTRSFTFTAAQCGISYHLKVRSEGRQRPEEFFTPGDGKRVPCSAL